MMSSAFHTFTPNPDARVHLYCLPCAGGGASMYRSWADLLPKWIEIRAVLLPGRQARYLDPAFTDCRTAADSIASSIAGATGSTPYALFGHSMGAMLAYCATRQLVATSSRPPALLGVAGWPVQGINDSETQDSSDDDTIWREVCRLGGSAAAILADPEMRAIALPILRADFALCRTYDYIEQGPLPLPVAVYGGVDDQVADPTALIPWKRESAIVYGPQIFAGGHFFLQNDPIAVTAALTENLSAALMRDTLSRSA